LGHVRFTETASIWILSETNIVFILFHSIPDVPLKGGDYGFMNEAFAPICIETGVDSADVPDFLNKVVAFINNKQNIWGNLSMSYFADPRTEGKFKKELDSAIDATEYGTVALNAWSGVAYGLGGS
jgi:hypothetical protein